MDKIAYHRTPRILPYRKYKGRDEYYPSPPPDDRFDDESDGESSDVLLDESADELPMIGNDALPGLDSVLEQFMAISGKEEPETKVSNIQHGWNLNLVPGRTVTSVCQAQYTGDGNIHGDHSVNLNTQGQTPVYEWVHLEQSHMDFDSFQKQVLDISSLSLIRKQSIANLFKRVPRSTKPQGRSQHGSASSRTQVQPFFIEKLLPDDAHTYNQRVLRKQMVRFWSLPFFYLGHPRGYMSALLQASYNDTTEIQSRQQAVNQVLNDSKLRLYIPQLWCLVIDQSFLITCAQFSFETIRGDLVSLTNRPSSLPTSEPRIFVSYGQNTVWQIPLVECKTWFGLLSHFKEFWYNHVRFFCLGKRIKPKDWPYVYNTARRAGKLILEFTVDRSRKFSLKRHAVTFLPDEKGASEPQAVSIEDQRGYVLAILSRHGVSNAEPSELLQKYLSQLDSLLSVANQNKSETAGRLIISQIYVACHTTDYKAVRQFVVHQIKSSRTDATEITLESNSLTRGLVCERIFAYAGFLFKLFLPLDTDARIVSKYWGAVIRAMQTAITSTANLAGETQSNLSNDWSVTDLLDKLHTAAQSAVPLFDMLEIVSPDDSIHLPSRFSKAWVWLVLFFICRNDASLEETSNYYMDKFKSAIEKSTSEFMNQSSRFDLIQQSVMLPTDVGILLNLQVLKDITADQFDIVTIYEEYRDQLDTLINTDSSQRSSQVTLHHFKEEIRILLKTAKEQEAIVKAITTRSKANGSTDAQATDEIEPIKRAKSYPLAYPGFNDKINNGSSLADKISARDPGGLHHAFASECTHHASERVHKLESLMTRVDALVELNERKFNANRDRQDLALYAFSIVTVIFLPISTVASILGMNTNDIRNLEADQWLFWAVATPLAITIVFGGLLWAGELGNTFRGFVARFQPKEKTSLRGFHSKSGKFG